MEGAERRRVERSDDKPSQVRKMGIRKNLEFIRVQQDPSSSDFSRMAFRKRKKLNTGACVLCVCCLCVSVSHAIPSISYFLTGRAGERNKVEEGEKNEGTLWVTTAHAGGRCVRKPRKKKKAVMHKSPAI